MKKILITGGAGFIGSHLTKKLLEEGNKVIVVDNLQTGRLENIKVFFDNENFTFIKHNIIEPLDCEVKLDEIYNLACPASPPAYQGKNSISTTKTCVYGSINMLELAKKNNAKILQASTSEVYGDPDISPQTESYRGNVNPIGVRSCYDEGKRCAESLFFDYHRIFSVQTKVIRIFNTYGPNMDPNDGRVVSNFICQALLNKDITVYGDGNQTRSFCFVSDLVEGIYRTMNTDATFTGPVNLGNPEEYHICDIAAKIIAATNSKSKIIYKDLPMDDPKQRRPDISKAKEFLNWRPTISFDEGLKRTIGYFKNNIQEFRG